MRHSSVSFTTQRHFFLSYETHGRNAVGPRSLTSMLTDIPAVISMPLRTRGRRRAQLSHLRLEAQAALVLAADLRCLICGHFLGEVVVNRHGNAVKILNFVPGPSFSGNGACPAKRCDKCGGALGLDEVQAVNHSSTDGRR